MRSSSGLLARRKRAGKLARLAGDDVKPQATVSEQWLVNNEL